MATNGTVYVVEYRRPYDTNIHQRRWYVWHEVMRGPHDRLRCCSGGAEFDGREAADRYAYTLVEEHGAGHEYIVADERWWTLS
jgi:hypothetical protein